MAGVASPKPKDSLVIDVYCYVLLAAAWIVDLLTPQLFVAAVLLNGPIALSAQALRPSLTIRLTVLAEIANVVAGYVNGVQAGRHWDAVAIGDRILAGATFVLVAGLTLRAQESARRQARPRNETARCKASGPATCDGNGPRESEHGARACAARWRKP